MAGEHGKVNATGTSNVRQLADEYWQWRLEQRPEFATIIGCHDYDDKLDPRSLESYAKMTEGCNKFLQRAVQIEDSTLSNDDWINLVLLKNELQLFISGCEVKGYYFPVAHADTLKFVLERVVNRMNFKNETDYEKLFSRFDAVPQQVDEVIGVMRQGIKEGITQHMSSMEPAVKDIQSLLNVDPKDTKFYQPFLKLDEIDCIPTERKQELCRIGEQKIKEKVHASFQTLITFLKEEYLLHTRAVIGCYSLPNGTAYYAEALKFHITCDLTPKEVYDIGFSEVNRMKDNMKALMKRANFQGELKDFFEHLKNDKNMYYADREGLIQGHLDIIDKVKKVLPKYFKNLPDMELSLEPIWEGPECEILPAGFYFAPCPDGIKPGTFYLNCYKPESRPKYEMMSLSLHEANPGHHLQTSYSLTLSDVPGYRIFKDDRNYTIVPSRFPLHSGYIEGWGMYCEYLGEEMGLYEDDYALFGSYCTGLQRACRSVLDPGLNVLGWSKEQAVEFLENNTPMSKLIIDQEILRCLSIPGQSCSYTIGQVKIKELRQKAQHKLGERFDIKDFHDAILMCGPVPLTVLETVIDKFIEKTLQTSE